MPNLHNGLIAATFTAVGLFVVSRRPGNREGWLFIATGLAHAVMFFGRQYGFFAASTAERADALPATTWVTWLGVWPLPLVLVLAAVTLMCFPDGRLPSPRWRPVVAVMAAAAALLAIWSALWPVEYAENSLSVPHPLNVGGYDTAQRLWNVIAPSTYLLIQLAWVACVVVRMRRAQGDEGRQLRWFAYAVAIGAAAMATGLIFFGSAAPGLLAVPVVAVAAGVAIVKYRLYDIDLVINRTLVYGALTALLAGTYFASVLLLQLVLSGVTANSSLAVAGSTLAVAALFQPARRRIQQTVDRRFYRRKYDAQRTLEAFAARLRDQVDLDALSSELRAVVADTMQPAHVSLWLRAADGPAAVPRSPRRGRETPSRRRLLRRNASRTPRP